MKKFLLIAALCFVSVPAMAEDDVMYLPGNAQVRSGNDGRVIFRGYDPDDLIYRRLVNPHAGSRSRIRNMSSNNDVNAICGRIERSRKRERCVKDYLEQREELIRRYND